MIFVIFYSLHLIRIKLDSFFGTYEILKCVKYIARESRVDGYVNKLNNIVRAQCPVTKPNVSIKENLSVKCSLVVIDDFTARP